ncbi:hypothetical protein [Thiorhodococcus minor]|uniref:Uncharacterized protein n=1 Tax=Thiorhodococcus minor TaxID=57489 RepID=A0A6M0JZ17_9GAMM|nr:hypothetical protein [Thiorhodococcus minor]NEV62344.1 hypothetical protein [Thiorhodococcus minor]
MYQHGLERWPAVFAAYLTAYVVDGYGASGNSAVWPYVADALFDGKRQLSLQEQDVLWQAYRRACIRLGLEVLPAGSVSNYRVAELLHQAGVPARYIDLLAERMLHHAKLSGTPEADDPRDLALWCDALIERLVPPVPITVARAIEADRGGFYARLFLSVLSGDDADPTGSDRSTRARMAEVVASAQTDQRQLLQKGLSIPRVVWRDDLLGVELPAGGSTEWQIEVDGQGHNYLGASEARFVPFEQSLPGEVRISRGNGHTPKAIEVWADGRNNRLLAFDGTGALAGGTCLNAGEPLQVEPGPVTLVLRFRPDGDEAALTELSLDPRLYAMSCELAPGEQLKFQRGPAQVTILARSRPTLALKGQAFRGIGGNELYATTGITLRGQVPLELFADDPAALVVALSAPGREETLELPIEPSPGGELKLDLEPVFESWTPGLVRLRVELRRSGLRRAMARLATWLWVGLTRIEDRSHFYCTALPRNLDAEASDNLARDEGRCILTYRSDAKRFFRLVFAVGSERVVQFTAAVPGAFMVLKRFREGKVEEQALRKGGVLALRSDSREVLEVYSTQGGCLRLGRMHQEISPRAGLRRLHLSTLAEYLEPGINRLSIEHPSGFLEPLLQLVTPHRVLAMSSREEGGTFRIQLDLPTTADALRCAAHDILTGQELALDLVCNDTSARLDRSARGWLTCGERQVSGQFRHTLEFPLERWDTGAWLLQVEARLNGHWGSLVNEREDVYAWGILLDDVGVPTSRAWLVGQLENLEQDTAIRVFKRIHQALLPCYAPDVWNGIRWLADGWQHLARTFAPAGGQLLTELLALDALTPPETSQASWFPLLMPGVALSWIYSAEAMAYRGVGLRAGLIGEVSQIRQPLCELFLQHHLEQTLAFGFRNVMEMQCGIPPHGFSLTRYRQALAARNIDDAWSQLSREDWRPAAGDYLGPVHWRFALGSLEHRYHATLQGNAVRRGWAMHLVQALHHLRLGDLTQGLPAHLDDASGLGVLSSRPDHGGSQEQLNLQLIDRLLCVFAAVCRWESRGPALAAWNDSLQEAGLPDDAAISQALGYLLYVGRDVFEFYLLLWELVFAADADTMG